MVFRSLYSCVMDLNASKPKTMSTKSCKIAMRKFSSQPPKETEAIKTFMTSCLSTLDRLSEIVLSDLNGGIKITIKNGDLLNDSPDVLKKYLTDLDNLDINTWFEERLPSCLLAISTAHRKKVNKTLREWFENQLQIWDQEVELTLIKSIQAKHVKKCNMQFGIFNFTSVVIGEDKLALLSKGHKVVLPLHLDQKHMTRRVEEELWEYARRYRLYIERNFHEPISTNFDNWLQEASSSAKSEDASNFYSRLIKSRSNNKVEDFGRGKGKFKFTKESLSNYLNFEGTIWNEADKGRGCVLLSIDYMKAAEKKTISNMGGVPTTLSKEDLIKSVMEQIDLFNQELDGRQRAFVTESLGGISASKFSEIVIPFLNLKAKIHKLSDSEIKNKDTSNLKFRPVVDQSRWILYDINRSFMSLIVSINSKILEASKGRLEKILPKNGHEVAKHFQDFQFSSNTSLKGMLSADLSDAYSNVLLHDLESSLETAAEIIGLDAWQLELVISIARLILKNNFVETSSGYYKLTECLAMGNSSSGACLDLVGLTREFERVGVKDNIPLDKGLPNLDKDEIISVNMSPLNSYMRYLDDTNGIFESDCPNKVMRCILGVGTMFPSTIEINVDIFHICGTFLDVVFVRKLATGKFVTLVRKELSSPPSYIPLSSAVPLKFKLSVMKSEMIRYRRICSEAKFVKIYENMLADELKALGYINIHRQMKDFEKEIKENYDTNMKKISGTTQDMENMVFGSTSKYEHLAHTHTLVTNILCEALGENNTVKLPMLVPASKLKECLQTRKSYLNRMK